MPMKLAGVDRRGKVMLCGAWLLSFICSVPQSIIFHVESHPNITHYKQCVTYNFFRNHMHEILYSFMGMIFMYALPLIIIIFCYASIYIELYKKSRKCITGWKWLLYYQTSIFHLKLFYWKMQTRSLAIWLAAPIASCWCWWLYDISQSICECDTTDSATTEK